MTLAVGIGANAAVFSLVHAMLVRPLLYPNRDRIVQIWATNVGNGWTRAPVSPLDFIDWRTRSQSFERMAAARFWFYSLAASSTRNGGADPEQVHGMRVSPGFFEALGVTPPLGRTFLVDEEQPGRDRVVILTHSIWQRRFAADPALIGQTVSMMPDRTWWWAFCRASSGSIQSSDGPSSCGCHSPSSRASWLVMRGRLSCSGC